MHKSFRKLRKKLDPRQITKLARFRKADVFKENEVIKSGPSESERREQLEGIGLETNNLDRAMKIGAGVSPTLGFWNAYLDKLRAAGNSQADIDKVFLDFGMNAPIVEDVAASTEAQKTRTKLSKRRGFSSSLLGGRAFLGRELNPDRPHLGS